MRCPGYGTARSRPSPTLQQRKSVRTKSISLKDDFVDSEATGEGTWYALRWVAI